MSIVLFLHAGDPVAVQAVFNGACATSSGVHGGNMFYSGSGSFSIQDALSACASTQGCFGITVPINEDPVTWYELVDVAASGDSRKTQFQCYALTGICPRIFYAHF